MHLHVCMVTYIYLYVYYIYIYVYIYICICMSYISRERVRERYLLHNMSIYIYSIYILHMYKHHMYTHTTQYVFVLFLFLQVCFRCKKCEVQVSTIVLLLPLEQESFWCLHDCRTLNTFVYTRYVHIHIINIYIDLYKHGLTHTYVHI